MRIGLQTWGSDGDVLPFLALAQGLQDAGHEVTLVVTSVDGKDYSAAARAAGVALAQTPHPPIDAEAARAFGRAVLRASPPKQMSLVVAHLLEPSDAVVEPAAAALAESNDVVIGHSIVHALSAHAERRDRAYVSVQYAADGLATREAPPAPLPDLGRVANALLWRVAGFTLDRAMLPWVNRVRRRAGVVPVASFFGDASGSQALNLVAASPSLVRARSDWPPQHVVCGALRPRAAGASEPLPDALDRFLAAGPPPLLMTAGSMLGAERSEAAFVRVFADAARRAGQRAIVQVATDAGAAAIAGDASIFAATWLPHEAVLPRCAAVVHHGGAGTSHAVARAGVPSVVVPYYLDQGGWALALRAAGIAAAPLPRRSLTPPRLASRIAAALGDDALRERAAALGRRMRDEDGVACAVEAIGKLAAFRRPHTDGG